MIRRAVVLAAAGAAAALTAAAPASAVPLCNSTTLAGHSATVCANVNPSTSGGAVADANASVVICPDWSFGCKELANATLGATGVRAGSVPPIDVNPRTGTISSPGGTVGTVYLHGGQLEVKVPNFCVGPPEY